MNLRVAFAAAFVVCALLAAGCFTPAQVARMQGPSNHAQSPTFDSRPSWRTAVLPPSRKQTAELAPWSDDDDNGLYDFAGLALMRTGRFAVVDRTLVDQLLAEQEFSYSGVVDAGTAAKLGRMLGAEAVAVINVTSVKHDNFWEDQPEQRDATLILKIISVETTEVLYTATGEGADFAGDEGALRMALEVALTPLRQQQ